MSQTSPPAQELALIVPGVAALLTVAIGAWLGARGDFTRRLVDDAPRREGELQWFDLIVALGLWLVLGGFGAEAGKSLAAGGDENLVTTYRSVGGAVGMLVMVGYVLVRASTEMREGLAGFGMRLRGPGGSLPTIVGGVLFTVLATFVVLSASKLIADLIGLDLPEVAHDTLRLIVESAPAERAMLIVVACVIAPLVEEIFFRGLFQTVLRQLMPHAPVWSVIAIMGVVFGLIHALLVPWPALLGLTVFGVLLGWLYERTGRLWLVIAVHAAFNAFNVVIAIGLADQVPA